MNCINIKSNEFQELLEASKLPSFLLELKVAKWQEQNGVESFPAVTDLELTETKVEEVVDEAVDFSGVTSEKADDLFLTTVGEKAKVNQFVNNKNREVLFGNNEVTTISPTDVLNNLIGSDVFHSSEHVEFFLNKATALLGKSGATVKLVTAKSNPTVYNKFDNKSVMMYDSVTNTIYVTDTALENFDSQTIASSFIHEVVHSTTVQAYFAPRTPEEKEFKRIIDQGYEQYKFLATKRDSDGNLSYGFTNQAEFIAEIFSNPEFRAEIQSIEKSWWNQFVDAVRRLFGMSKNILNNELINSSLLFETVDEFGTRNKSQWKGTLSYDPRYSKLSNEFFNKVQGPEGSTLDEKLKELVNVQLNSIEQIIRRANAMSKKYGTKNAQFIQQVKLLDAEVAAAAQTNKLEAINNYTNFMITQINHVFDLIEGSTNELEKLETIERYKSYLGASDLLKPIMDTLNDTRTKNLTPEEQTVVKEIQRKLRLIAGTHEDVKSKFRAYTTESLRQELKHSYYSEKVVQEFRAEIAKEYPTDSPLSKKEWVNEQIVLRQTELDERIEKDINDVVDKPSADIDGFDKNLLTAVNTKSRLIQIVMKVITKMKTTVDNAVRSNDFNLDKLYQDLVREKGKYDITNLYETTKDGETFLKGEYSIEFRDKYINEYSKYLDDVNKIKAELRKQGKIEYQINQSREVQEVYGKLTKWRKDNLVKEGRLLVPNPKYKNKLNFSKAEQAIYDEFVKLAINSEKTFGKNNSLVRRSFGVDFYTLPYATVSNLERVTSGRVNVKDTIKQKISNFTDWKIDDLENNSQEMYRQDGTLIHNIPIMYRNNVNKFSEPEKHAQLLKEQSFDLLTLMRLEHYNQTNFEVKSKNEMLLNSFIDVSRDKQYLKTKPGTNNLVSNVFGIKTKYVTFEGVESNEYKRLQSIINQSLYNTFYEEAFKIKGKDVNKIVQSINKHTSFLGMSLNYFNAPVNVINAEFQTFMIKIGGDINSGALRSAHLAYAKDLPNILADAGRPNKHSFVNQLNLLTDVFGGLTHDQNDFIKNTILKGITDPQMLQIMQTGGEHMVQSVLNMALLKSIKVMNDKGQYINKEGVVVAEKEAASIFDMVDQDAETKEVSFNTKFTYTDKSTATKWEEGGLENVRLFIKKKIFDSMGEYDKNFQTDIQRHWWGQLLMMYKKFIIPLGIARYRGAAQMFTKRENLSEEDKHWNESLQQYEEGFYTTTFRYITRGLVQNLVKLKFDTISKDWNTLTEYEKSNIKKGITELAIMMMLQAMLVPLLVGMAGDDDDEALMYIAMLARRTEQELSFYTDPNDAYKVTKNPIASMNLIEDLLDVGKFTISPGLWFSERKDGTPRAYKVFEKVLLPTSLRPDKDSKAILQGMNRGLLAPYEEGLFYRLVNE